MKERPDLIAADGPKPLFDPENDKLYTTREVAELFSVSNETVRDWINAKKLTAIRLGSGQYRVRRSDLQSFAMHKYGDTDTSGDD